MEQSEEGSNKRALEEETYFQIVTFLQKCEGETHNANPVCRKSFVVVSFTCPWFTMGGKNYKQTVVIVGQAHGA